jgi:hypothetical protein
MRHTQYVSAAAVLVLVAAPAAGPTPAGAQVPAPYVRVFVDGQPVTFDVPPQIDNGRLLVPLRGVFERLGATVDWNNQTQTVYAQRGGTNIAIVIGSAEAMVDGQPVPIDAPAMVVDDRTMVPLRFVSQTLGSAVNWDAPSSTVVIGSGGAAALPPSQSYGAPGQVPPSQSYRAAVQVPPSQSYGAPVQVPPSQTSGPNAIHVAGRIVAVRLPVDPGSPGMIAVRHDGTVSQYYLRPSTAITHTNAGTGYGGSAALGGLRVGDWVEMIVNPDTNVVRSIRDTYPY